MEIKAETIAGDIASNFASPRYFFRATLLVAAEAGVWTQVSYLPPWLLKTTTVLAALSFLALTFEPTLKQRSGRLVQLTWTLYAAFVIIVLYGFWGNFQQPPFNATIRATTEYEQSKPISVFMVIYQSPHGPTASPICSLMFLEFVNRQDFEMKVDHYVVEVGPSRYLPWWYRLRPIPLTEHPVFAIGIHPGGTPTPGKVWLPKGTYWLGEPSGEKARAQLKESRQIDLSPYFEMELTKPIGAHQTIQGWAAFDKSPLSGHLRDRYLRITVTDSAGSTSQTIMETPLPLPDETDTGRAMIQPTTVEADLSGRYLKFYSQP